jgi:DNA-binding MarR family transcriptional regulator
MLVSGVFDSLVHGLHERLPAAGFADIRPTHCTSVFRVIDSEGTRPTELARRAAMTPQAMAELVRYLEEHGYVHRVPDPHDGRGRIVKLTERGVEAAAAAGQAFADIESAWEHALGDRRMTELRAMLGELMILPA